MSYFSSLLGGVRTFGGQLPGPTFAHFGTSDISLGVQLRVQLLKASSLKSQKPVYELV